MQIDGTNYGGIYPTAFLGGSSTGITGKDYLRNENGDVICDENGYPLIDTSKQLYIGNREPDFLLGLGSNFRYKELTASFLFDGRCGGDVVMVLIHPIQLQLFLTKQLLTSTSTQFLLTSSKMVLTSV